MSDIKIHALTRLLKRVYLGGLIGECILNEEKNGVNSIAALDLTNSIVLTVFGKTGFEGFDKLGISDLATITKYLETAESDTTLKVVDNRLIFKNKNGTFKYLLADTEVIPTSLDDKDALQKLIEDSTHEVKITEDLAKNFSQSMALTKTNSVSITVGDDVYLSGGLDSEHQFRLQIGKPKKLSKKEGDKFTIPIYGTHLLNVLNVIDWSNAENLPSLFLKKGKPIIIKQNKDSWALTISGDK